LTVDHDISGLEIPVEDALGVCRGESRAELPCNLESHDLRRATDPLEEESQLLAVDMLH